MSLNKILDPDPRLYYQEHTFVQHGIKLFRYLDPTLDDKPEGNKRKKQSNELVMSESEDFTKKKKVSGMHRISVLFSFTPNCVSRYLNIRYPTRKCDIRQDNQLGRISSWPLFVQISGLFHIRFGNHIVSVSTLCWISGWLDLQQIGPNIHNKNIKYTVNQIDLISEQATGSDIRPFSRYRAVLENRMASICLDIQYVQCLRTRISGCLYFFTGYWSVLLYPAQFFSLHILNIYLKYSDIRLSVRGWISGNLSIRSIPVQGVRPAAAAQDHLHL